MEQTDLNNINIERAILGTLFFEPQRADAIFRSVPTSEIFYLPANRHIYEAAKQLWSQDLPIDEEFVAKALRQRDKFDESALLDVMATNPLANTKAYIDELVDLHAKRNLVLVGAKIQHLARDINVSGAGGFAAASELIASGEKGVASTFSYDTYGEMVEEDEKVLLADYVPLPVGYVSMLSGAGGVGKSKIALNMAIRYILEKPEENRKAFLWLSEDSAGKNKKRARLIFENVCTEMGIEPDDSILQNNLMIKSHTAVPLIEKNRAGEYIISAEYFQMRSAFRGADMIFLDPLLKFYGLENENDNAQAARFMGLFTRWAAEEGKAIVLIHHHNKEGKTRGASELMNSTRATYEISPITDGDGKVVPSTKLRFKVAKLNSDPIYEILRGKKAFDREVFTSLLGVKPAGKAKSHDEILGIRGSSTKKGKE